MKNLTRMITPIFIFCWLLQFGFLSYGQGQLIHHAESSLLNNELDWNSNRYLVNKHILINYWMNKSYSDKKMGYFHIDDQLTNDQNIYLTYNYELNDAKASFGFSMNNSDIFSVQYNHAFSIADWFKQ